MPIACDIDVEPVSERSFRKMDYAIMRLIFDIHNKLGRLCDEMVYQKELGYRCEQIGLADAATEVPIRVWHSGFEKTYYVDLLANGSIPYEMKVASGLTGENQAQALNYILLLGVQHGKLVNMGAASVQHRFVSTTLKPDDRYKYLVDCSAWSASGSHAKDLKQLVLDLVADWGMFLSVSLFSQAVEHLLGGRDAVVRPVELFDGNRPMGCQRMQLLTDDEAFHISAIPGSKKWYSDHLARLLSLTKLTRMHWINMDGHRVVFRTVVPR